jgi:hypothetical protein
MPMRSLAVYVRVSVEPESAWLTETVAAVAVDDTAPLADHSANAAVLPPRMSAVVAAMMASVRVGIRITAPAFR